ncbi:MetQ/NlpA family ABC transporter substrate-binding protein [Bombilactobacillus folatiphilus]|uniref:Lipoprotein n=1 Tax=Bombilactobacillus folatiphilus TaxID=2923362 RepID=A0ABY4P7A8_9LACO|nr:MetQ/NlpA family ABC transporter substrate-binding protein [Bombilactobacillus folatiphilus]UQS81494.1 MetQ/NlpA family ABC transporter substrate-binding protein [Bombilactobacillus folatiphilus]
MKKLTKIFKYVLVISSALLLFVLTGCGQQSQEKTVKVGINNADAPAWKVVQKKVKKEHINLKIVEFSDYNQPNTALLQHELDINAFQHHYFLDNWNKAHHADLVAIGDTMIQPMAMYSNKVTKVSELPDKAKISLPNDSSNEARALELLESVGLIKLRTKKNQLPSTKNVADNPHHLQFKVLDAAQTAHSLNDVDAAVINGNVASAAKLSSKKVVYREKVTKKSRPWINVIAANKKDKNNPTYKKIVKAYQSDDVLKEIHKIYGPNGVAAWKVKL